MDNVLGFQLITTRIEFIDKSVSRTEMQRTVKKGVMSSFLCVTVWAKRGIIETSFVCRIVKIGGVESEAGVERVGQWVGKEVSDQWRSEVRYFELTRKKCQNCNSSLFITVVSICPQSLKMKVDSRSLTKNDPDKEYFLYSTPKVSLHNCKHHICQ